MFCLANHLSGSVVVSFVGASQAGNEDINVPLDTTSTSYIRKKQKTSDGCMRKKLLVFDVNGLLVDISSVVPYDYDPDAIISKKAVFKRRYCDDFLKFCFETFNVGVWSSRNKRYVDSVLDFVLGNDKCKLVFCWDQSHCTYTDFNTVENREKPLILKKLKKLWEKCEPDLPWERGEYNKSNTLLLDDSPYKAICNPPYTAIFPYTYRLRNRRDNSLGPGGDLRVYLEGLTLADNVQDYIWSASNYNMVGSLPSTLEVREMVVSSELIYFGCKSGTLEVWCKKKQTRVETLQSSANGKFLCMAIDDDEDILVIGTFDGIIQAWKLS